MSKAYPELRLIVKSMAEIHFRKRSGVSVMAMRESPDGAFQINPPPETIISHHSIIIVLGTKEQVNKMKDLFSKLSEN